MSEYIPSKEILEKYADLLVNFALNDGRGISEGESVLISIPESAKPMYVPLRNAVLRAGAYPMIQYMAENVSEAEYYSLVSDNQLEHFFAKYYRALVEQFDHSIALISNYNKYALKDVNPEKILKRQTAHRPYMLWREEKEVAGKYTWTLALYATESMAKDAGVSLEEYWKEIILACYLDQDSPIDCWKRIWSEIDKTKARLDSLKIEKLHIVSPNTDLILGIGKDRKWLSGSGRNIPSFEIFTSPNYRETEGRVSFNQPLYYLGKKVENIWLEFKAGVVVNYGASSGLDVLREMLLIEGANRVGEFSLTDSRHSRISHFMGETLYDENLGQPYGNMHLAIGSAYKEAYAHNSLSSDGVDWDLLGYNQSAIHVDIISTQEKEVTAVMDDGSLVLIYKNGNFLV